jgi:protein dithiol oxidoreductase (disulfide-forming)
MSLRHALALAAATLTLAFGAAAQPKPNVPYERLTPAQPTDAAGKIEVIEFFWYGCPHCYRLEPSLNQWLKNKPADVVFKRVHAIPNEAWGLHAYIYYTLEAMGLLEQYHSKVFEAIHKDQKNLTNRKILDQWLQQNGIDPAKYHEVEKSFSVNARVKRAAQMTVDYKVDGVPRVFVDGKLYTGPEFAGGEDHIMEAVDQMIAAERKAGAGASTAAPAAAAPKKK